ncbi:hypothetical protein CFOL_v3_27866 [Cephalotus follicularis]|uniref:UBN2 domain-containing protein n=1 Tax=Cephalotus follicularis TaxID=3775 RepID=A0A1Q3CW66_CEPFO|nr:hypothetical protein CFOL_v3_27866 [Cephalotus follicularis]
MAIEEVKDLTTLPLEQLLGSLMTYETTMKNHESEVIKVRKTIALRASKEVNESDEDGDMTLITSQFKKFLKSQKDKKAFKKYPKKEESSKREELICSNAKSRDTLKVIARVLKRKSNSRKAMSIPRRRKLWLLHGMIAMNRASMKRVMVK